MGSFVGGRLMALSSWFSGAAAKSLETEVLPEERQSTNDRNGHGIVFHADPVYPLLIDPTLVTAAEHFGVVRTRVLNAHTKLGLNSVIVTSPQKEEGKSLVCANLAISLGQLAQHRVLLVDGDLRVKGVTRLLGMQHRIGVGDYLQEQVAFEACIHPTNFRGVSVAAVGHAPEESLPGILEGPRWAKFVEEAKQQFDLVIVDSVPVSVPIADFELLSAACDGALLIIQLHKTTREALSLTAKQLGRKLIGVIINNAQPRVGFDYYSHYSRKRNVAHRGGQEQR
jgi:capsular exopolysaccharide synthesis family protein